MQERRRELIEEAETDEEELPEESEEAEPQFYDICKTENEKNK